MISLIISSPYTSHAPRERVSWNFVLDLLTSAMALGHAPRERVSWNRHAHAESAWGGASHAPRERVSWNFAEMGAKVRPTVTLHVSVWVEMRQTSKLAVNGTGHAPRERVSWNGFLSAYKSVGLSHAPRERVSWNIVNISIIPRSRMSRSTWACELKFYYGVVEVVQVMSRSTWACELKYQKKEMKFVRPCHAPRERVSWNCLCDRNI